MEEQSLHIRRPCSNFTVRESGSPDVRELVSLIYVVAGCETSGLVLILLRGMRLALQNEVIARYAKSRTGNTSHQVQMRSGLSHQTRGAATQRSCSPLVSPAWLRMSDFETLFVE